MRAVVGIGLGLIVAVAVGVLLLRSSLTREQVSGSAPSPSSPSAPPSSVPSPSSSVPSPSSSVVVAVDDSTTPTGGEPPATSPGAGVADPPMTVQSTFCPRSSPTGFDSSRIEFRKVIEIEPLTPGFAVLEGPVWADDRLYMSHIGSGGSGPPPARLLEFVDGTVSVVDDDHGANGMTVDTDGRLFTGRHRTGVVEAVDGGEVLADGYQGTRFNSPNDLVISSAGNLYFTDPDWQAGGAPTQSAERAYVVDGDGNVSPFASNVDKPNGVFLSMAEDRVYVGGVNGLFVWGLDRSGAPTGEPEPVQPGLIQGVDGLSRDCAGNLYVTKKTDGDQLLVLDGRTHDLLGAFDIPGITNVAFGGDDGLSLFVTALGPRPALWVAAVDIPGLPY